MRPARARPRDLACLLASPVASGRRPSSSTCAWTAVAASAIVSLARVRGPRPSDPGSSPGGGMFCISPGRPSNPRLGKESKATRGEEQLPSCEDYIDPSYTGIHPCVWGVTPSHGARRPVDRAPWRRDRAPWQVVAELGKVAAWSRAEDTAAILAQGTHWAAAHAQAFLFCPGSSPAGGADEAGGGEAQGGLA